MNVIVKPTVAPGPKTKNVRYASVALAAIFVLLAVAQLYSFEEYPDVIASMGLPGGRQMAELCAALVVVGEVAAVPFLLSMRLSPAMRIVSMIAGWLVIVSWLKVAVLMIVTTNAITNSGVLGATVPLNPGWWMVVFFLLLAVIAGWVSWRMWPISKGERS